jgi:hypothetical protein
MKKWAIHTLFMSIILGFCQKIHTFSLRTSLGGFRGPVLMCLDNLEPCTDAHYSIQCMERVLHRSSCNDPCWKTSRPRWGQGRRLGVVLRAAMV